MAFRTIILRRALSTQQQRQRPSIGQVFMQDDVQTLLKDITRYDEKKIFSKRQVPRLKTPKMMFMTNEDLEQARQRAFEEAKARLQMPPVMDANNSEPRVLAKDEELVGYTRFKIMFVDISPGQTHRSRIMSVRERDGTLRFPTYEERSRLNHIYYPNPHVSIDPPKLFEEKNMIKLLQKGQYEFILNRACVQFEPDDPRYVDVTTRVYDYIDMKSDFNRLRSTRFFGPMSLYFAYNKKIDNLLIEMLSKKLIDDAVKLVKIFNVCHNIECKEKEDKIVMLNNYSENHSSAKYNLDLALQNISPTQRSEEQPDHKGTE